MYILEAGQMMLPAKCSSCGSSDTDRKYIDLGFSLDYYGAVYYCTFCFNHVARELHFVEQEVYASTVCEVARFEEAVNALTTEMKALKNALAAVLHLSDYNVDDHDNLVDRIVSAVQAAESTATSIGKIPKQSKGSDKP